MRSDQLKGHLDMLLLAAVAKGPSHGYAIIETLRARSGGALDLAEGTVYPALHQLEHTGFIKSRWSADSPRKRRVYELTARGRGALSDEVESWRTFYRTINRVLGGSYA